MRFTLRDMMERGESEEELDQASHDSARAEKGSSFPMSTWLVWKKGFCPTSSSIDEDNIDEERRLAYVGITRAQQELTFTRVKNAVSTANWCARSRRRFLPELPQDDLIWGTGAQSGQRRRTDAERAKPSGESESDDGGKTRGIIKAGKDVSASHPALTH
ncbi:3'-5' exonuclease [Shigella sonnei]